MKQRSSWKQPFGIALVSLALLALLAAVFLLPRLPKTRPGAGSGRIDESRIITQNISGQLAYKSLDDLKKESTLIAVGIISGSSEPFQIRSVEGGFSNFTDYSFQLEEVYRGDALPGDTVSIREEGGLVGYLRVVRHGAPELVQGERYLLFLHQPGMGGGYYTDGDSYYLTGAVQGVFKQEPNSQDGRTAYVQSSPVKSPVTGEAADAIVLEDFTVEMERFNKEFPIDPESNRKTFENSLKANLDNGIITQDGYEELLAESREYATVLEPEYGPDGRRIYPQSGKLPTYAKDMTALKQESSLVALGTVTGIENTLQIQSVKGLTTNFTDYTFQLEEVYRGEFEPGSTVTVRKEGGVAGDLRVEAYKAPDFQVGERLVLFLYQPNLGGDFNTEGDYFYPTGAYQGIFKPESMARSAAASYSSDAETLDLNDFAKEMAQFNKTHPVDPYYLRNTFEETLREDLENGAIDQRAYDEQLAQSRKYAKILIE